MIGSPYIKLTAALKNPKKEPIIIKNIDQKCFLWCHIRYINLIKIYPERITKKYKDLIDTLGYSEVELTVSINDFSKIEKCFNFFRYENKLTYPIHISDQKFENSMDLLVIFDGDKSHYAYIKDFDRFMFSKTKKQQ